jgi:anti-anti-sigma factor
MEDAVLNDLNTRLANYCSMRSERQFHTTIVSISGEFDLGCQERFQDELRHILEDETESLVLDLRGLRFIDSIGLQTLIRIDALARSGGFRFTILCGEGQVRAVLRETGLDGVLPLIDPFGVIPTSESPA